MSSQPAGGRATTFRFVWLVLQAFLAAGACSAPPAPKPPPVPAPAPVESLPATLAEARPLRSADPARFERALTRLSRSSDPVTARRALALLGLFQLDGNRWSDASTTLDQAAEASPAVASFLRLRVAESQAALGNAANASAVAARIIATSPDSSAATIARLRLPALYAQLGDRGATDAAFTQAMAMPVDELTEGDFASLAGALDARGRSELGTAVRMRLLVDYPQGRLTEQTYREVASLPDSPLETLSLDDALSLAQRLGGHDRYDQEFELLARIGRRFPEAATGETFRTTRVRALFSSRRYGEVLTTTAGAADTPALAMLRARAGWRAGQAEVFLSGLKAIEKRWPVSREAADARILRAKYYVTDVVDYPKALENLTAAIRAGTLGNDGENLWTLGWTHILAGNTAKALETLEDYVLRYPDGDFTSNSLFWSGKILETLGRREERDSRWRQLIAAYPYSYFSYRARALAAASPVSPDRASSLDSANPGRATFPDLDAAVATAPDPRLETVRELEALDLVRDASREMRRIAAAYPDNPGIQFMLADVYVRGGEPFKANGIIQRRFREFVRHGGNGIPRRFWEILFPLNYWPQIQAAAAKEDVDPYVVASIIRQESGFEPHTVSNAGAVGLMQIMPHEAEQLATRAGMSGMTRERLFDPEANIQVGATEYAQKLALMHGNAFLAIASYNAGPEAVERWLAQTPVDDIDRFVEAIPYAETRLYVKTVTRNRFEYRRIYEAGGAGSVFP